jgi:uncharacterized membrane protein
MWNVGTREVVYMAIGAALYAVLSYLFNGTVFVVPSVSQVALRPAIAIPMFFGFAFGPVVGFFAGAVGNMFGDALTGFGLYPQWSVGNGLVGFIAGLVFLFKDRKKSLDTVLIISAVVAVLATVFYLLNRNAQYAVLRWTTSLATPYLLVRRTPAVIGGAVLVIRVFVNIDVAAAPGAQWVISWGWGLRQFRISGSINTAWRSLW